MQPPYQWPRMRRLTPPPRLRTLFYVRVPFCVPNHSNITTQDFPVAHDNMTVFFLVCKAMMIPQLGDVSCAVFEWLDTCPGCLCPQVRQDMTNTPHAHKHPLCCLQCFYSPRVFDQQEDWSSDESDSS